MASAAQTAHRRRFRERKRRRHDSREVVQLSSRSIPVMLQARYTTERQRWYWIGFVHAVELLSMRTPPPPPPRESRPECCSMFWHGANSHGCFSARPRLGRYISGRCHSGRHTAGVLQTVSFRGASESVQFCSTRQRRTWGMAQDRTDPAGNQDDSSTISN